MLEANGKIKPIKFTITYSDGSVKDIDKGVVTYEEEKNVITETTLINLERLIIYHTSFGKMIDEVLERLQGEEENDK